MKRAQQCFLDEVNKRRKNIFTETVHNFLRNEKNKCLIVEAVNFKEITLQIIQALEQLLTQRDTYLRHPKLPEKYLTLKNQTYLSWSQLLKIIKENKNRLPKLQNALVCEIQDGSQLEGCHEIMRKIVTRLELNIDFKIIFVSPGSGLLDKFFIQMGLDIVVKSNELGITSSMSIDPPDALLNAVMHGRINDVKTLIDRDRDLLKNPYISGDTILHRAAMSGHKEVVFLLVRNGADINALDKVKDTPFHSAVKSGHPDIVRFFLENSIDVNIRNGKEQTALHIFRSNDVLKVLLEYGADVDMGCDKDSRTLLHIACLNGFVDTTQILLSYNASVNIEDCSGHTPLHFAALCKAPINGLKITALLIEKGAQIILKNQRVITPLAIAVSHKKDELAEFLKSKGATS